MTQCKWWGHWKGQPHAARSLINIEARRTAHGGGEGQKVGDPVNCDKSNKRGKLAMFMRFVQATLRELGFYDTRCGFLCDI